MTTHTLILDYPSPPKPLHSNFRGHFMARANATAAMRQLVAEKASDIPKMQRCSVQITWVVATRHKRDADGPEPMCKAIFDALGSDRGVSARIVPDDSPEFMDKPRLVIEYQPGVTPHIRVDVTDISNPYRPDAISEVVNRLENE